VNVAGAASMSPEDAVAFRRRRRDPGEPDAAAAEAEGSDRLKLPVSISPAAISLFPIMKLVDTVTNSVVWPTSARAMYAAN